MLEPEDTTEAAACELSEAQWAAVQRGATWQAGGPARRFADLDGPARTLTGSYRSSYKSTSELVQPTPATHSILTVLKAGETVYLIYRV